MGMIPRPTLDNLPHAAARFDRAALFSRRPLDCQENVRSSRLAWRQTAKPEDAPVPPGLFREKALSRLSSPDELDRLMRISSPASRLTLAAALAATACALIWGIFGSLSTEVTGRGILLTSSGMFTVTAQSSGEITNLYFAKGGGVGLGQTLARIAQPVLADKVESARTTLAGLREKLRLAREFGGEDTRLNLEALEIKKRHLAADIANLRAQAAWHNERIKSMTPHVARGGISQSELFKQQTDLASVQERLSEKEYELNGIKGQILEQNNKTERDILDLAAQVAVAEEELRAAMTSLQTAAVVTSPYSGRVIEAGVNVGSVTSPGAPIATLELSGAEVSFMETVMFFNPDQGQRVKPGMVVHVSPDTARPERYGSMLGLITKVAAYPSSQAEMKRILQNPELAQELASKGVKVEVRCALVPDPDNVSGAAWSSSSGPDFPIKPGTLCSASVIVERQRPIALVIPLLNKYVLGRGVRDLDDKQ
jgi:HlyD family secretion protein